MWLTDRLETRDIDKIISAEIPDPEEDPELHEFVLQNMIHGPCGPHNMKSPCMNKRDKICEKNFPKDFLANTVADDNNYISYRRRTPEDGGFLGEIKTRGKDTIKVMLFAYSTFISSFTLTLAG